MAIYEIQRHNMVTRQLREAGITHERLLSAMADVPRHHFVPADLGGVAYSDGPVPVSAGRYLLPPYVLASMLECLALEPDDVVFDGACATGYSTAILAHMGNTVIAREPDETLRERARHLLLSLEIDNAVVVAGDPLEGLPDQGPFDAVLLGGEVSEIPEALFSQLSEGGRLVALVKKQVISEIRVSTRRDNTFETRSIREVHGPLLLSGEDSPSSIISP